ncbi:hypothetical protein ACFL6H_09565 [Candidatus Latescibacterota bacterium]
MEDGTNVTIFLDTADNKINCGLIWDIRVNNPAYYSRVLAGGSLAPGESYMDGWRDCDAVDEFFDRIFRYRLDKKPGRKHSIGGISCKIKLK